MKILWQAEDEEFVIGNDFEMAIPISYEEISGDVTIFAYPSVKKETESFLRAHAKDLFSDVALADLYRAMAPFLKAHGYTDDRFRDRWGYIFRGTASYDGIKAERLAAADEEYNRTTYDLALSDEDGRLMYGVKENGYVVAVAVTHENVDDAKSVMEVGVETVPPFRGRGYAKACLSALSQALKARGMETEYRCQRYNRASYAVAAGAGLSPVGKYYYYVGRK